MHRSCRRDEWSLTVAPATADVDVVARAESCRRRRSPVSQGRSRAVPPVRLSLFSFWLPGDGQTISTVTLCSLRTPVGSQSVDLKRARRAHRRTSSRIRTGTRSQARRAKFRIGVTEAMQFLGKRVCRQVTTSPAAILADVDVAARGRNAPSAEPRSVAQARTLAATTRRIQLGRGDCPVLELPSADASWREAERRVRRAAERHEQSEQSDGVAADEGEGLEHGRVSPYWVPEAPLPGPRLPFCPNAGWVDWVCCVLAAGSRLAGHGLRARRRRRARPAV